MRGVLPRTSSYEESSVFWLVQRGECGCRQPERDLQKEISLIREEVNEAYQRGAAAEQAKRHAVNDLMGERDKLKESERERKGIKYELMQLEQGLDAQTQYAVTLNGAQSP